MKIGRCYLDIFIFNYLPKKEEEEYEHKVNRKEIAEYSRK